MKHSSHPHELYVASHMVSTNQTLKCFGCQLTVSGTCYACTRCNFYLHEACFKLPQSAHLDSHPKHTLRLVYPPDCQNRPCDACGQSCNGFTYNCGHCKYNIHPSCATSLHSKPRNENASLRQRVEGIETSRGSQLRSSDVRSTMQQLVEEREYLREMEMLQELERMELNVHLQFMKNMSDTMDALGRL